MSCFQIGRTQGTGYGGSAVEGTIIEETEGTTHAGHGAQPSGGGRLLICIK